MIRIGDYNTLEIIREAEQGIYLSDADDNEVLLPNRYVPETFKIWEKIEIYPHGFIT